MSKQQPDYVKETPGEWRPLDIRQLEKFQTLEINHGSLEDANAEEFRLLYDGANSRDAGEAFCPVHRMLPGMDADGNMHSAIDPGGNVRATDRTGSRPAAEAPAQDKKQIEQQAYAEGFSRGEQEGLAAGKKQVEEMAARLQTLLFEIEGLWQRMAKTYEKEILALVFRIAEKVVMGQIQSDNETVKRSILKAFEIIPEPSEVKIKIHPNDYEFIELIKEDIFIQIKELKQVELISDHSVNRGGCVIETRSGNVVVDIEKRLESIKTSMIEANRIKG